MSRAHPRLSYRHTIVSLWKTMKKASLKYEDNGRYAWKDLVLRDKKGKEVARVMTYGHYGNNDLRYTSHGLDGQQQ